MKEMNTIDIILKVIQHLLFLNLIQNFTEKSLVFICCVNIFFIKAFQNGEEKFPLMWWIEITIIQHACVLNQHANANWVAPERDRKIFSENVVS
jgi:hypothetical protein